MTLKNIRRMIVYGSLIGMSALCATLIPHGIVLLSSNLLEGIASIIGGVVLVAILVVAILSVREFFAGVDE